ncbi:MAG: hypothetical protein GEU77_14930 [Deltaproteobacteria bacterium]|nr:hypothetical protein [Deltaproteobacteria bacterium]
MELLKKYVLVVLIAAVAVSTAGCKRNEQGEGPAEQAGKTIDKAVERAAEETGRLMDQAGETIQNYGGETKKTAPDKGSKSRPASP